MSLSGEWSLLAVAGNSILGGMAGGDRVGSSMVVWKTKADSSMGEMVRTEGQVDPMMVEMVRVEDLPGHLTGEMGRIEVQPDPSPVLQWQILLGSCNSRLGGASRSRGRWWRGETGKLQATGPTQWKGTYLL